MKRSANTIPSKTRQARPRANGSGRLAVTLTGDHPESKEKREKRLAARKARTLRAFQMAYEDHHRRKAS